MQRSCIRNIFQNLWFSPCLSGMSQILILDNSKKSVWGQIQIWKHIIPCFFCVIETQHSSLLFIWRRQHLSRVKWRFYLMDPARDAILRHRERRCPLKPTKDAAFGTTYFWFIVSYLLIWVFTSYHLSWDISK